MSQNTNLPPEPENRENAYLENAAQAVDEATGPIIESMGKLVVDEAERVAAEDAQAPGMVDRLIEDSRSDVSANAELPVTGVADEAQHYIDAKTGFLHGGDRTDTLRSNAAVAPVLEGAVRDTVRNAPDQQPGYAVALPPSEDAVFPDSGNDKQ